MERCYRWSAPQTEALFDMFRRSLTLPSTRTLKSTDVQICAPHTHTLKHTKALICRRPRSFSLYWMQPSASTAALRGLLPRHFNVTKERNMSLSRVESSHWSNWLAEIGQNIGFYTWVLYHSAILVTWTKWYRLLCWRLFKTLLLPGSSFCPLLC